MPRFRIWFALLALGWLSTEAQAEVERLAGQVLSKTGTAHVEAIRGESRVADGGTSVFSGETLVTGADGRLQVKFIDHGMVSLRPDTRFRIDEFEFEPDAGKERSFFSLAKGGFRAVTGRIGKKRHQDYRITTPVATLGVRGTDFGAILCSSACAAAFKSVLPGLYVRVNSDAIIISQAGVDLVVRAGQVAFVKDSETPAVILDEPPPEHFWSGGAAVVGVATIAPALAITGALIALPIVNHSDDPVSPDGTSLGKGVR